MSFTPLKRSLIEKPYPEEKWYKFEEESIVPPIFNPKQNNDQESLSIPIDGILFSMPINEICQNEETIKLYFSKVVRHRLSKSLTDSQLFEIRRTENRIIQLVQKQFGENGEKCLTAIREDIEKSFKCYLIILNDKLTTISHKDLFGDLKLVKSVIERLQNCLNPKLLTVTQYGVLSYNLNRIQTALEMNRKEQLSSLLKDEVSEKEIFKSEEVLSESIELLFNHLKQNPQDREKGYKTLNTILSIVNSCEDIGLKHRIQKLFFKGYNELNQPMSIFSSK